jgi:hypothetical protein
MSRMKILNAVEQEQFESPPVFNSVQRKQYFDFSSELLTLAQDLQTPTNQVCFLVSCGYFKAAKRFFPNRRCSRRDLDYVAQQLGFQPESIDVNSYSATTRLRHERLILDFYGFRPFDSTAKSFVAGEIEKLARSQLEPALILWRIVERAGIAHKPKSPLLAISTPRSSKTTGTIFSQAIANGSVVSWQHINLLGEYDFSDEKLQDSVGIKPPKLAA